MQEPSFCVCIFYMLVCVYVVYIYIPTHIHTYRYTYNVPWRLPFVAPHALCTSQTHDVRFHITGTGKPKISLEAKQGA